MSPSPMGRYRPGGASGRWLVVGVRAGQTPVALVQKPTEGEARRWAWEHAEELELYDELRVEEMRNNS